MAGLGQLLPLVRFGVLVARATEICQEVKSLGGHLLSAIEKQDAEDLAILRARHERVMLDLAESVRYGQWQEAVKAREGLETSFQAAVARYAYYERLLARPAEEIVVPPLDELDAAALQRLRFTAREPELTHRPIEVDIADDLSDAKGRLVSTYEASELAKLKQARNAQIAAHASEGLGALLALIPEFEVAIKPFGAGGAISMSGQHFSAAMSAIAREGGAPLRAAATAQLRQQVEQAATVGSVRLLSVRHEFPTAWARFTAATPDPEAALTITLREEHYPFWASRVAPIALHHLDLFAEPGPGTQPTVTVATAPDGDPARTEHQLPGDVNLGGLRAGSLAPPLPPALGELTLHFDDNSIADLWLALTWGSQP